MPLQLACISDNNIAVVQYLIDRGAEVNAQRWSKKHSADKSQAVAGAIGSTALHVACANGCVKTVDLLLRNNALVDVKDKYGSSPLDIAAAKHHVEIVRLLETFGAMQQQNRRLLQPRPPVPHEGRRSMDVATMTQSEKAERFRRPSLPSVFEGKAPLHVPPVETLPPRRKS
ncbi:ankyrin repeat-containing domain protein, partial [Dichotomocladium elegans]